MTTQRLGLAAVAAGLLLVVLAQLAAPLAGPPLYDGVVPTEPYRWLSPPPDHPGGAKSASATIGVSRGQNDLVAVATPELSPQAQVFATPGALTLPAGTTSIKVSIEPVQPVVPPADGYIDGNVYRILVTDQRGRPVTATEEARVSVVLRSADPSLVDATVELFDGTAWQKVRTSPPVPGDSSLVAIVTRFGDFAVVGSGTSPYPTNTPAAASSTPTTAPASAVPPSPTESPMPQPSGGGGIEWQTAASIVAILAVIVATAVAIAIRRRRRPYRGAHQPRKGQCKPPPRT